MSFADEFEKTEKERGGTSEFYKFKIGDNVMRIMTEPVKKESRFGYGICYPGAPYCDPAVMEQEWKEKQEQYEADVAKAKEAGRDPKLVKKPSRPNTNVKWTVWGLVRATGELAIVDLTNSVAEKLLNFMRSDEYSFKAFPMPYDINIKVTKKKVANPGPKDIEYDVIASRKDTPVTEEELKELERKAPISQIMERMQAKQKERFESGGADADEHSSGPGIEYPKDDINPDDIPF